MLTIIETDTGQNLYPELSGAVPTAPAWEEFYPDVQAPVSNFPDFSTDIVPSAPTLNDFLSPSEIYHITETRIEAERQALSNQMELANLER